MPGGGTEACQYPEPGTFRQGSVVSVGFRGTRRCLRRRSSYWPGRVLRQARGAVQPGRGPGRSGLLAPAPGPYLQSPQHGCHLGCRPVPVPYQEYRRRQPSPERRCGTGDGLARISKGHLAPDCRVLFRGRGSGSAADRATAPPGGWPALSGPEALPAFFCLWAGRRCRAEPGAWLRAGYDRGERSCLVLHTG